MPDANPNAPFTVTGSRSAGQYNVVTKNDAVWIVPVTPDGEVVLIRSYRHTLGEWCWELPAGSIKDGQTPLEAARDELAEEIGGRSDDWAFVVCAATMNGLGSEIGHVFVARNVTLGPARHESTEVITVHPVPLAEALRMCYAGEINDAISMMALLAAAPRLLAPTG